MSTDIEDLTNKGVSHLHVNNMKLNMCKQYEPVLY